jgi:acyl-phosphate glycerol 3-phosphate acyltransferase
MLFPLLTSVLAYLLGAVPFGLLAGWLKGIDVRKAGSGNIGATNVGRLLGRPWGIGVFLLDMAKGLVGVALGAWGAGGLPEEWRAWGPTAGGVAAFLGHLFPIYLGFRGGKGVATGAGVALGLLPAWCLEALAIWVVVTVSTRMVSAGSLASATWLAGRSLIDLSANPGHPAAWFGLAGSLFVGVKHRANFGRILHGSENRLKDGWLFQNLPPALHLMAVGAWLGLGCFVTFVAGLGIFDSFNAVARLEPESRPYWLQVPPAMFRESPGKAAGLPDLLRMEQGGILAGRAVSVLFGPFFQTQVALAWVVVATAFYWLGTGRLARTRVWVAGLALVCALAGAWIEKRVEGLRSARHQVTESYLLETHLQPEADTTQAREVVQRVRSTFGAWHGVSVGVNLLTLACVGILVVMAFPAVRCGKLEEKSQRNTRRDDETEVALAQLPVPPKNTQA